MNAITREGVEVEALHTDRYLESLLAWGDDAGGGVAGVPLSGVPLSGVPLSGMAATERVRAPLGAADPPPRSTDRTDPAIRLAAVRLQRDLQRVHPSFRFEERLARRLADVAAAMQLPLAAGAEGRPTVVLPFPFRPGDDPAADELDPETGGSVLPRPVLIGGAVASAALSIVGAAFVAWRLGRGGDPMARAVRAAHQLRVAGQDAIAGPGAIGGSGGLIGPRGLD